MLKPDIDKVVTTIREEVHARILLLCEQNDLWRQQYYKGEVSCEHMLQKCGENITAIRELEGVYHFIIKLQQEG